MKDNRHGMPELLERQTRANRAQTRTRDENVKRTRDYGRRYLMWRKITG